jgi:hypothetical protein
VLFTLGLVPALASAQESASGLSNPRGGGAPATTTPSPPATTPHATTPHATTPHATTTPEAPSATPTPSSELGQVPPPPPTAYDPAVRYPTAGGGTARPEPYRVADSPDLALPSRVATRLRVLDSSLQALAARGGSGVVDGVLSIVGGATLTGIGIWQYDESRSLGGYLLLWGSSNVIRGIVTLALNPRPARDHIAFTAMPMATMDEVMARLTFGENALETLARRSKVVRVLDASLNMAAGIAFIPMYLAPNDFKIVDPFDYFILIGSGISVLSGVISLFTRSDAERRWDAYQDLRDRLVREGGDVATREPEGFRVRGAGVAPLRDGAALTLDATF